MEQVIFKVGDRVFDIHYGWGTIDLIHTYEQLFPVKVIFDMEYTATYTLNGSYNECYVRSLYHHDYTPNEEPMKQSFDSGQNVDHNKDLRLKIAGMAMQGYLAANCEFGEDDLARYSIKCADALIKALNEEHS